MLKGTYKQSPVLSSLNILAKILFALLVCLVELSSVTVMVSFNKACVWNSSNPDSMRSGLIRF